MEPEEHISIFNIKNVIEQQKAINFALKMEKDKNALLLKEKDSLNPTIKNKDELILAPNYEIQNQQEKLSKIEKGLSLEKDKIMNEALKKSDRKKAKK